LSFGLVLALSLMLVGCGDAPNRTEIDLSERATSEEIERAADSSTETDAEFLFGFDLRNGPREDAKQYLPLLDYLSRQTGYRFRLHFTEDAGDLLTELASGKLQFAAIGAGTYLTAQSDTTIIPLVRGVNAEGEPGYRSILIVAPESRLQSLHGLKGKRVAFGSQTSTQGHWIPRIMFDEAGMALDDLGGYLYTGSHRACAEAVIGGRADACGMQDTLARLLIKSGSVRALATSAVFPSSGIFSTAAVPAEVRHRVQSMLVDFDPKGRDREGLYHWERTEMAGGFTPASADDYADLRSQAQRLGLLPQALQSADAQ
jgi:phosphonate transport system substrate-binding protein